MKRPVMIGFEARFVRLRRRSNTLSGPEGQGAPHADRRPFFHGPPDSSRRGLLVCANAFRSSPTSCRRPGPPLANLRRRSGPFALRLQTEGDVVVDIEGCRERPPPGRGQPKRRALRRCEIAVALSGRGFLAIEQDPSAWWAPQPIPEMAALSRNRPCPAPALADDGHGLACRAEMETSVDPLGAASLWGPNGTPARSEGDDRLPAPWVGGRP